ncbi:MAG: antitoxin Xre-like helix-turn-helix domain-containing protein [Paludibacter sp.]
METIIDNSVNSYIFTDSENDIKSLITAVRNGINFNYFLNIAEYSNFNLHDWATILHLSERTMQRYKKESLTFEPLQSEKILQIALILQKGQEVFGNSLKFNNWINADNQGLGGVKPKELLDNSFGIKLIEDELVKIEHGVLA